MPHFLIQAAYTPEAWAKLIKNPQNRMEATRPALERVGARWLQFYFAFGEYDVIGITEAPDNISAAAISAAVAGAGALKTIKTTPLLTTSEAAEALRKGADVLAAYAPPGEPAKVGTTSRN